MGRQREEELLELVGELLDYFEMEEEEWPMISVWTGGEFVSGVVADELYEVLTNLKEIWDEHDNN